MKRINITKARDNLADILNRVAYAKDRYRITKRGKPIAAVIPIEDLKLLERLETAAGKD
jgi:prevent-host-death family protein